MRFIDEDYLAWIRLQRCVLAGRHLCWGPIAACHIKTRGSGGGDDQVFAGCITAHAEQEGHTKEFEERWNIDLGSLAAKLRKSYLDRNQKR
jgi:hypothetical protein